MAGDFKEVDSGFWPDPATVVAPKKWDIYYRAVERYGQVIIEKVYPPVGETTAERTFDLADLNYAEADTLVVQIMAAMAEIAKREKKEKKDG